MDKINVILDTDMENEIDDQFALTYLLKSIEKFNLEAITIAPFSQSKYQEELSIEEGINKSYNTTLEILKILNCKYPVYKGSNSYFNESKHSNEAVDNIIKIALKNEKTIIIAIGAITNIALAINKNPNIISKIKVIWLGGNSFLYEDNNEFNFKQDIKAVQKVFDSQVELVVIPCKNVSSSLSTTTYELNHYLLNKSKISDYLCDKFNKCINRKLLVTKDESSLIGISKTLWDLSAIAYVINKEWFKEREISCPIIKDNGDYLLTNNRHKIIFVYEVSRNKIFKDFFTKMSL